MVATNSMVARIEAVYAATGPSKLAALSVLSCPIAGAAVGDNDHGLAGAAVGGHGLIGAAVGGDDLLATDGASVLLPTVLLP